MFSTKLNQHPGIQIVVTQFTLMTINENNEI